MYLNAFNAVVFMAVVCVVYVLALYKKEGDQWADLKVALMGLAALLTAMLLPLFVVLPAFLAFILYLKLRSRGWVIMGVFSFLVFVSLLIILALVMTSGSATIERRVVQSHDLLFENGTYEEFYLPIINQTGPYRLESVKIGEEISVGDVKISSMEDRTLTDNAVIVVYQLYQVNEETPIWDFLANDLTSRIKPSGMEIEIHLPYGRAYHGT